MTLNPTKCVYGYNEVSVLGNRVNESGIRPNSDKIKAVRDFPTPRRLRALRSFVGLANYYRSFVQDFSKIVGPLVQLTRENARQEWREEQKKAFKELKERLVTAPILRHFDPNLPLELHTDASDQELPSCKLKEIRPDRQLTDLENSHQPSSNIQPQRKNAQQRFRLHTFLGNFCGDESSLLWSKSPIQDSWKRRRPESGGNNKSDPHASLGVQ